MSPEPTVGDGGGKETLPARQAALKLSRIAGQVTARMVPDVGHVWALQNPDLFAATVLG